MKSSNVQTLIVTMDLKNVNKLLAEMNIQTEFIIGNQTTYSQDEEIVFDGKKGKILARCERGVGKNRNTVVSAATADICVFADDDMRFKEGYEDVVREVFSVNKNADVIIFNIDNASNRRRHNKKNKTVNIFNYMKYGATRITFRRKDVSYHNITFNCNFGGGTPHHSGEDSLFLRDCLAAGLKIVAVPVSIAELSDNRESTWFHGYNDKYLYDKGAFLELAHPVLALPFAAYLIVKHPNYIPENKSGLYAFNKICEGIKFIKNKGYYK